MNNALNKEERLKEVIEVEGNQDFNHVHEDWAKLNSGRPKPTKQVKLYSVEPAKELALSKLDEELASETTKHALLLVKPDVEVVAKLIKTAFDENKKVVKITSFNDFTNTQRSVTTFLNRYRNSAPGQRGESLVILEPVGLHPLEVETLLTPLFSILRSEGITLVLVANPDDLITEAVDKNFIRLTLTDG